MILIYDIIKCITFRRVLVALRQVGLCHMICTIRGWPVRPNTCSEKLEQYTAGIVEKATTAVSDRSLRSGFGYSSFARRGTAVLDGRRDARAHLRSRIGSSLGSVRRSAP